MEGVSALLPVGGGTSEIAKIPLLLAKHILEFFALFREGKGGVEILTNMETSFQSCGKVESERLWL